MWQVSGTRADVNQMWQIWTSIGRILTRILMFSFLPELLRTLSWRITLTWKRCLRSADCALSRCFLEAFLSPRRQKREQVNVTIQPCVDDMSAGVWGQVGCRYISWLCVFMHEWHRKWEQRMNVRYLNEAVPVITSKQREPEANSSQHVRNSLQLTI